MPDKTALLAKKNLLDLFMEAPHCRRGQEPSGAGAKPEIRQRRGVSSVWGYLQHWRHCERVKQKGKVAVSI